MNEDTFNMEIRKYLKTVGITSQREIEQAVYKAIESGGLQSSGTLDIKMTLEVPGVGICHCIDGRIALE